MFRDPPPFAQFLNVNDPEPLLFQTRVSDDFGLFAGAKGSDSLPLSALIAAELLEKSLVR